MQNPNNESAHCYCQDYARCYVVWPHLVLTDEGDDGVLTGMAQQERVGHALLRANNWCLARC